MRFLGWVTGGWIGLRVLLVWQATGSLPEAIRDVVPVPFARALATITPAPAAAAVASVAVPVATAPERPTAPPPAMPIRVEIALVEPVAPLPASVPTPEAARLPQTMVVPLPPGPRPSGASPLTGSAWFIVRGGTGIGAASGGSQLGGSQGGLRADYAIGRGLALTGRLAAPLSGIGREAAVGVAWRPAGVPVRLVVEQRIALDSGRGGPAIGVSGGVGDVALPAGFRMEGYAQAGAVARDGIEPYADGAMRGARPLGSVAGVAIDAGAGAWGGAQRGAARLDIGPTLVARLPVADRTLRLTLDWRERIAGDASPGSGPALSLGTDF